MIVVQCGFCKKDIEQAGMGRTRQWCSDACRKAAGRARPRPLLGSGAEPAPGGVRAAVDVMLGSSSIPAGVDTARASLAVALASMVDRGDARSVAAAKELRQLLSEMNGVDDEASDFLNSLQVKHLMRRQGTVNGDGPQRPTHNEWTNNDH